MRGLGVRGERSIQLIPLPYFLLLCLLGIMHVSANLCWHLRRHSALVHSRATVAPGKSGSININRNSIGGLEFQGEERLSLLISLSDIVLICLDESVQTGSGWRIRSEL